MLKSSERTYCIVVAIIVAVAVGITLYAPYREMQTFNKFKSEEQPRATYLDAVFSKLRITSK